MKKAPLWKDKGFSQMNLCFHTGELILFSSGDQSAKLKTLNA
jgi:hypothetical protein